MKLTHLTRQTPPFKLVQSLSIWRTPRFGFYAVPRFTCSPQLCDLKHLHRLRRNCMLSDDSSPIIGSPVVRALGLNCRAQGSTLRQRGEKLRPMTHPPLVLRWQPVIRQQEDNVCAA